MAIVWGATADAISQHLRHNARCFDCVGAFIGGWRAVMHVAQGVPAHGRLTGSRAASEDRGQSPLRNFREPGATTSYNRVTETLEGRGEQLKEYVLGG